MSPMFDNIESAHEYVGLLLDAIDETASAIEDSGQSSRTTSPQRRETLQLIAYKLQQLRIHVDASHRRLNDLRILSHMLEGGHPLTPAG